MVACRLSSGICRNITLKQENHFKQKGVVEAVIKTKHRHDDLRILVVSAKNQVDFENIASANLEEI